MRRSWGRTAVIPDRKFSLLWKTGSDGDARTVSGKLFQTCSSRREGSVADGSTHGAWGDERWRRRRAQPPTCAEVWDALKIWRQVARCRVVDRGGLRFPGPSGTSNPKAPSCCVMLVYFSTILLELSYDCSLQSETSIPRESRGHDAKSHS